MPTIREAFRAGDLEALRSLVDEPVEFPNGWLGREWGYPLEYAIYHSPRAFVRELLGLGADPNYQDDGSFPALLAALSTDREDRYDLLKILLQAGADIRQRGVNDYTPLHFAATRNDPKAVELLLAHGADPAARTRIDEHTTALEEAERLNYPEVVKILKERHGKLTP